MVIFGDRVEKGKLKVFVADEDGKHQKLAGVIKEVEGNKVATSGGIGVIVKYQYVPKGYAKGASELFNNLKECKLSLMGE